VSVWFRKPAQREGKQKKRRRVPRNYFGINEHESGQAQSLVCCVREKIESERHSSPEDALRREKDTLKRDPPREKGEDGEHKKWGNGGKGGLQRGHRIYGGN